MVPASNRLLEPDQELAPAHQPLFVVLIKFCALMVLANRPLLCVLLFQPVQQDRRSAIRIGNVTPQHNVKVQVSKRDALQLLLFFAQLVHARLQSNNVVSREVVLHLLHVVVLSVRMVLAKLPLKIV
jgi:hypothetical protein